MFQIGDRVDGASRENASSAGERVVAVSKWQTRGEMVRTPHYERYGVGGNMQHLRLLFSAGWSSDRLRGVVTPPVVSDVEAPELHRTHWDGCCGLEHCLLSIIRDQQLMATHARQCPLAPPGRGDESSNRCLESMSYGRDECLVLARYPAVRDA